MHVYAHRTAYRYYVLYSLYSVRATVRVGCVRFFLVCTILISISCCCSTYARTRARACVRHKVAHGTTKFPSHPPNVVEEVFAVSTLADMPAMQQQQPTDRHFAQDRIRAMCQDPRHAEQSNEQEREREVEEEAKNLTHALVVHRANRADKGTRCATRGGRPPL